MGGGLNWNCGFVTVSISLGISGQTPLIFTCGHHLREQIHDLFQQQIWQSEITQASVTGPAAQHFLSPGFESTGHSRTSARWKKDAHLSSCHVVSWLLLSQKPGQLLLILGSSSSFCSIYNKINYRLLKAGSGLSRREPASLQKQSPLFSPTARVQMGTVHFPRFSPPCTIDTYHIFLA